MPDHNHEAKAPPSHPVPGVPMAWGGGGHSPCPLPSTATHPEAPAEVRWGG